MKKYLLLLLFAVATTSLLRAQVVADSNVTQQALPSFTDSTAIDLDDKEDTDDEPNVIGARRSSHSYGNDNLIGTPIYYDSMGNALGGSRRSNTYQRPERHYLNDPGIHFNSYFLEFENLIGYDYALGLGFTYLPRHVGGYGKAFIGIKAYYYAAGAAFRIAGAGSRYDWHLYGGLLLRQSHERYADDIDTYVIRPRTTRLGGELGVRWAQVAKQGKFCWLSATMGMAYVNRHSFLTVGVSLEVAAIGLASLFLW